MTAQEQQKTIEFLTMLDRKHPYVSVNPNLLTKLMKKLLLRALRVGRQAMYVIEKNTNHWLRLH